MEAFRQDANVAVVRADVERLGTGCQTADIVLRPMLALVHARCGLIITSKTYVPSSSAGTGTLDALKNGNDFQLVSAMLCAHRPRMPTPGLMKPLLVQ